MQMQRMQQRAIVPILEGTHAGMRSEADSVMVAEQTAGISEKRECSQKSGRTESGNAETPQGRFYPFWHYALGYKEKWFTDEREARTWGKIYGYKPDF